MPQSTSRWTAQASAVRKKDPVLYRLRTLSRTTTMGRRAIVIPHGTLSPTEEIVPTHISKPTVVEAAGNLPKRIEEFAGRVNSGHASVRVSPMGAPPGLPA